MKKYIVKLTEAERAFLLGLTRKGQASSRKIVRCQILLLSDEGAHRPRHRTGFTCASCNG